MKKNRFKEVKIAFHMRKAYHAIYHIYVTKNA